ncbi:MAG: 50S ribosomal protein L20 [Deltaproteobacteria bacterium]|nr:50S ribosomal protein L20 [Deltaproteobacteria bacterium]
MRVKRGVKGRRHRNKTLKLAKGYFGGRRSQITTAYSTVDRALRFSYRDRKVKKRDFRGLWITRIGIAAQECGVSYSVLAGLLRKKSVALNRKSLSDIAITDPKGFSDIVAFVRQ